MATKSALWLPPVAILGAALQVFIAGKMHSGFDGIFLNENKRVETGDLFHQLHHRYFECNYGTAEMPWDLDDWEGPGNTQPAIVMLPALLAAAQIDTASRREMADAYAVGFEVICRLGEAVRLDHYARGFHSTAALGSIATAAAVARLLKLDEAAAAHALSLAASQAIG